jgi:hypothetical protein
MSNIYVEGKTPKGPQIAESLAFASVPAVPSRGVAVTYGSDSAHAAVAATAGEACIGLIEEDVISGLPARIVEFGQAVAQIGASVTYGQALAVNASAQLVPAVAGQSVVAIALESNTYVSPGSFACVFVLGVAAPTYGGSQTYYYTASGALAPVTGTHVLNGAAALAMTLVAPPNDGIDMFIVAQTAHAHTVTTPADGIENLKHVLTYAAEGDSAHICSAAATWMRKGALTGPTPCALS